MLACVLASPFLAKHTQMSFAGLENPPPSPLGRGDHCAPAGGYMRRERAGRRQGPGNNSIGTLWFRGLARHCRHLLSEANLFRFQARVRDLAVCKFGEEGQKDVVWYINCEGGDTVSKLDINLRINSS